MRRLVQSLIREGSHRFPRMKALLPVAWKRFVLMQLFPQTARNGSPNRLWMEAEILPRIARCSFGTVLLVGCAPYTWHYHRAFKRSATRYVTTDINPSARIWGAKEHITCRVEEIHKHLPLGSLDVAMLNGVFGFGVNTEAEMNRALWSIHRVLARNGLLLLGWNTDLVADPLSLRNLQRFYRHEGAIGLPARKCFENDTHVYDLLRPLERRGRRVSDSTAGT